jgi:hypothetical protein
MVLQAPTVGAPVMPPARPGPAYDGAVAPRVVRVSAAAPASIRVVEILMAVLVGGAVGQRVVFE